MIVGDAEVFEGLDIVKAMEAESILNIDLDKSIRWINLKPLTKAEKLHIANWQVERELKDMKWMKRKAD